MKKYCLAITLALLGNATLATSVATHQPAATSQPADSRCESSQPLLAHYRVTQSSAGQPSVSRTVMLVRDANRVAYRYEDRAVTELWERAGNDHLHLVRYFDNYQRGIEYQADEIKGGADWATQASLVSPQLRHALQPGNSSGSGCEQLREYTGQHHHERYQLVWQEQLQLPQRFEVIQANGGAQVRWELVELNRDKSAVEAIFHALDGYQTTDYADVGDSESDPFLQKMINLGFIEHGHGGFYDAEGHSLSGGHHH